MATVRAEDGVAGFFPEGERGKWFVEHDDGPFVKRRRPRLQKQSGRRGVLEFDHRVVR